MTEDDIEKLIGEISTLLCDRDDLYCCVCAVFDITEAANNRFMLKAGSPVIYKRDVEGLPVEQVQAIVLNSLEIMQAIKQGSEGCDNAILLMDAFKAQQFGLISGSPGVGSRTLH